MTKEITKIKWLDEPEEHDYAAAADYLFLANWSLITPSEVVAKLKKTSVSRFHAKDIARAAGWHLLGVNNHHVKKNLKKIKKGEKLSPVLLVRGDNKLIIADGFHRVSAVYQWHERRGEDALIPCKIV